MKLTAFMDLTARAIEDERLTSIEVELHPAKITRVGKISYIKSVNSIDYKKVGLITHGSKGAAFE